MVTDRDITVALLIALIILLIALTAWPGYLRLTPQKLKGFWASQAGTLYEIRPTGVRTFEVRMSGDANVTPPVSGIIVGVRDVRLFSDGASGPEALCRMGKMEIGGRRLAWGTSGGIWSRQGIARR